MLERYFNENGPVVKTKYSEELWGRNVHWVPESMKKKDPT